MKDKKDEEAAEERFKDSIGWFMKFKERICLQQKNASEATSVNVDDTAIFFFFRRTSRDQW